MTYVYTPTAGKHATHTFPDSGDTGAAGAAAAAAALESIADNAACVGSVYLVGIYEENLAGYDNILDNGAAEAFGTDDYDIRPAGITVATKDWLDFSFCFQAVAASASVQEYELGYNIGIGSVGDIAGALARFDALGTDSMPVQLCASMQAAADGLWRPWLRSRAPGGSVHGLAYGPWRLVVRHWRPTT